MSVVRTVVIQPPSKDFQSSVFQSEVERAVQKFLTERHVADNVAACTIDLLVFMVTVAKFVRNEFEKGSFKKSTVGE